MLFKCSAWFDAFLDLSNDWQMRPEWERLGNRYLVSLYADRERHDGTGISLDSAAFQLVQKLRPDVQETSGPQAGK